MRQARTIVRILRQHPFASDAALALLLAVLTLGDVLTSRGYLTGSLWIYVPAALLITVPLAWRRREPLVVVAIVMGAFAAQAAILDPKPTPDLELVPALIAVYSVALHGRRWRAYAGGGLGLAAALVWLGVDDFLLPVVLFGGAWLAGRLVQKRQLWVDVLEQRAEVLEREREANARMAVAEERVRLARELHDVVGHSVSVMVVQAGAERLALGNERPGTRDAMLAIERTGREALAAMSRLLGLLRRDGESLALAPRPTLARVDALLETVRDTGVSVTLQVVGEPIELPPGLDVSAYRLVQEALTNVVKHAGAARASVVIRYGGRDVEVEVEDDGRGPHNGHRNGYGLAGMRERVELHGGTFEAGAAGNRGFVVKASLPLETVQR